MKRPNRARRTLPAGQLNTARRRAPIRLRTSRIAGLIGFLAGCLFTAMPVLAQDPNFLHPIPEIERFLRQDSLNVLSYRGTRAEFDRTQYVILGRPDGSTIAVKWARAPLDGSEFNNEPRYEIAAYELQKLFLGLDEYVVPPTVARVLPLDWYRQMVPSIAPTFRNTTSVVVVLQYWLFQVSGDDVWNEDRARTDSVYARYVGNLNMLTYLIRHNDSNGGNFLISTYAPVPRVFAVDNGVAFRSVASNRGSEWRNLRVKRLPRRSVEQLRTVTREQLDAQLGILVQYRIVDGVLIAEQPGSNLDPSKGVRQKDGIIQFGLTRAEIGDVYDRMTRLLRMVDEGDIAIF